MATPTPTDMGKLRLALRQPYLELPVGVGGRPADEFFAAQNRPFQPPGISPPRLWVREMLLPSVSRHSAVDLIEILGLYQLDICYPVGHGTEPLDALALSVVAAYNPKRSITRDGVQVSVDQAAPRAGGELEFGGGGGSVWYATPVRITFRTYYDLA